MNAHAVIEKTTGLSKRAGQGVVNIAGKAKDYVTGVGSLVVKDVKKIPGAVKRIPSNISKAVRSKIEINIIMPHDPPKDVDEDHPVINS